MVSDVVRSRSVEDASRLGESQMIQGRLVRLMLNLILLVASTACGSQPTAPLPVPESSPVTPEKTAAWYQACWTSFNDRDFAGFTHCYADNAESRQWGFSGNASTRGPDAIVASSERFARQHADSSGHPQLILINDDKLASISILKGTNTAPLIGADGKESPATNKKFGLLFGHAIEIDRQALRVVKEVGVLESGTLAGQLGLRPPPFRPVLESGVTSPVVVVATNDAREIANLEAVDGQRDAFNRHDLTAWSAFNAPNLVFHEIAAPADASGEATGKALSEMWTAFADLKLVLDPAWAAGDYVIYTGFLEGTNTGPFPAMGIRSRTNRKIRLPFLEIDRMDNGKFAENWIFYDGAVMAMQLGLTK